MIFGRTMSPLAKATVVRPDDLTARQFAVLEGISRRHTIKVIASNLSISESAVNQHIRALKLRFAANSLFELSAVFAEISESSEKAGCRKTAYRKKHLPVAAQVAEAGDTEHIEPAQTFHDALTFRRRAPWEDMDTVSIVPGVLNGVNGRWFRAAAIIAITVGLFAAVLVGLGAVQGVSETIAERRTVPDKNL